MHMTSLIVNRLILKWLLCFLVFSFTILSCKKTDNNQSPSDKIITDNFNSGIDGWSGDFADYPNDPSSLPLYQLEFTYAGLPLPLNTSDGALKLSGSNRSDDLFMFIKKKVTGLLPGKNYTVELKIEFASNAANNRVGVGGAPGESVYIKAGVVPIEPKKILNTPENWYRMNIDKGNQSVGGKDMTVIGNFANGTEFEVYKLKQLNTLTPIKVLATQQGEIWLIIGTDSGFEATTTIYYTSIQAIIKPA